MVSKPFAQFFRQSQPLLMAGRHSCAFKLLHPSSSLSGGAGGFQALSGISIAKMTEALSEDATSEAPETSAATSDHTLKTLEVCSVASSLEKLACSPINRKYALHCYPSFNVSHGLSLLLFHLLCPTS